MYVVYTVCVSTNTYVYMHVSHCTMQIVLCFSFCALGSLSMLVYTGSPPYIFLTFYLFFRERRKEREKEGETVMCERNIDWLPPKRPHLGTWPTSQACALTRNRTGDPSVSRPVFNPLNHASQSYLPLFFLNRRKIQECK